MSEDNKIATMLAVGVIAQTSREAVSNTEMLARATIAGVIVLDDNEIARLLASSERYSEALRNLSILLGE